MIPVFRTLFGYKDATKYFLKLSFNLICLYWMYGVLWKTVFASGWAVAIVVSSLKLNLESNLMGKFTRPKSAKYLKGIL